MAKIQRYHVRVFTVVQVDVKSLNPSIKGAEKAEREAKRRLKRVPGFKSAVVDEAQWEGEHSAS